MKKAFVFATILALAGGLAGCDSNDQDKGVVIGGLAGGLIGSQFGSGGGAVLAAVGGAIAGAVIGGAIGHNMDETDKLKTQQALEDNKTDQSTTWKNPDNGNNYNVTPTKTYQKNGQTCRNYTMLATIDGKAEKVNGVACRNAKGQWINQS